MVIASVLKVIVFVEPSVKCIRLNHRRKSSISLSSQVNGDDRFDGSCDTALLRGGSHMQDAVVPKQGRLVRQIVREPKYTWSVVVQESYSESHG